MTNKETDDGEKGREDGNTKKAAFSDLLSGFVSKFIISVLFGGAVVGAVASYVVNQLPQRPEIIAKEFKGPSSFGSAEVRLKFARDYSVYLLATASVTFTEVGGRALLSFSVDGFPAKNCSESKIEANEGDYKLLRRESVVAKNNFVSNHHNEAHGEIEKYLTSARMEREFSNLCLFEFSSGDEKVIEAVLSTEHTSGEDKPPNIDKGLVSLSWHLSEKLN